MLQERNHLLDLYAGPGRRAIESKMTELEILQIEIEWARHELEYAENRLNNADQDFVEAAVYELLAKQKKLDALIRKAKEYA